MMAVISRNMYTAMKRQWNYLYKSYLVVVVVVVVVVFDWQQPAIRGDHSR